MWLVSPSTGVGSMALVNIAQIIVSIVLVLIILVQVREAGSGLFGAAQNTLRTRRGMERTLFQFTIILTGVFPESSISANTFFAILLLISP